MTMRILTCLIGLALIPLTACSNGGGGGGGGGLGSYQSSPGPDSPCNPATHTSGCRIAANQVMTCDVATSKWQEGALCGAGTVCKELVQAGAAAFSGSCELVVVGATDTGAGSIDGGINAADGGGADTGAAASDATTGGSDGGVTTDGGGTTDAGTIDSGTADGGMTDIGTTDSGVADTGTPDTGMTDTGMTDTGTTDGGGTDPLIEPTIAQPPVGSTVLAPTVTCPIDGTKVTNDKNGYKVVYYTKKTAQGDVLHGSYEAADSQGNLRVKSCYIDGKPAGSYAGWYADGTKRAVLSYTATGEAQGPYQVWDEKGNTIVQGVFKGDELYGNYKRWYDGGTQVERELYFNPPGQLRGVQKNWHENGKESRRSFYDDAGLITGTTRNWDDKGNLEFQGNYVNGLANGVHTWWHASGALQGKVVFVKGTGTLTLKHENGNVSDSGALVAGKREGAWASYASDGTKTFQGDYKANVGPIAFWFASGAKGIVSAHDEDLQYHGSYTEWASDGVQTWFGKMKHGLRVGTWQYSPQSGQTIDICYADGGLLTYDTCPAGLVVE